MTGKPYPLVQVNDILIHKALVFLLGSLLVRHYMETGEQEKALNVGKLITLHDMSKWEKDEFDGMCQYQKFLSMKDGTYPEPPPEAKDAMFLHFSRNAHHPEYYGQAFNSYMCDDDICEMAIDRFARGLQFTGDPEDVFIYFKEKDKLRDQYSPEFKERFLQYLETLKQLFVQHQNSGTELFKALQALVEGVRHEEKVAFGMPQSEPTGDEEAEA